jgi:hypothetical protein
MENLTITAKVEVLASSPLEFNGEIQKTKDGQPLFEVAYKAKQKVKVGDQELETEVIEKCKSLVNLEPGLQTVTVQQFHMSDKGTSKVTTYNRIISTNKK